MSKWFKLILVATSLAPIFLTYWVVGLCAAFKEVNASVCPSSKWIYTDIWYLVATVALVLCCHLLLRYSHRTIEVIPVNIVEVSSADKESIGFILVYLLPLAQETTPYSLPVIIFVAIIFFFVVLSSNSYHFNPLLTIFGYHFYDVKVDGGLSYVLLTKRNVRDCRTIHRVHLLSDYMILDSTTE